MQLEHLETTSQIKPNKSNKMFYHSKIEGHHNLELRKEIEVSKSSKILWLRLRLLKEMLVEIWVDKGHQLLKDQELPLSL
jgi:hypothetical protein